MTCTKSVELPVSPDEAFALITEPERLRRWKTVSATVDLRAGGSYRFTVVPGNVAVGTYREIEPGRRIVFGWGWEGSPDLPPDASTVTVTLEPNDSGGTRVTLVHEGLSPDQEVAHAAGWDHFLDRLGKLASTGDAGQDDWDWIPERLDPVTASDAVLAAIQPVLRGLRPEHAGLRTPCRGMDCQQLTDHFRTSLAQLGAMAGVAVTDPEAGSEEDRISAMAAQAIDGWRARGFEGSVPSGGNELPASFAVNVLPVELLLHGWDLAQATGQQLRVSEEVVAYVRELAGVVVPAARPGGSFGPEVPPEQDAHPLDQLAAFAGRTPLR